MIETNVRKCKSCGEDKTRTLAGKYNLKDKKWVDEDGKLWNGSTCPKCHKDKVNANRKKPELAAAPSNEVA